MTTALSIPSPTYEIVLKGKSYPEPERTLSEVFVGIQKQLTTQLSIVPGWGSSLSTYYATFGQRVSAFQSLFEQIKKFLCAIHRSNLSGNDQSKITARLSQVQSQMNRLSYSPAAALTAEVAVLPETQQLTYLNKSIEFNIHGLVALFGTALDQLVEAEQVGLIEWFSPKVCRYHYYIESHTFKDTILDRRTEDRDRMRTETVRSERTSTSAKERHQHDLVDVQPRWLKDSYVPYRVEQLAADIPDLFKPYFTVVTGNQINEHVIRREDSKSQVVESRSTWKFDPALVIGEYVIAGWDAAEQEASKMNDQYWNSAYNGYKTGFYNYATGDFEKVAKHLRRVLHTEGKDRLGPYFHQLMTNQSHLKSLLSSV